MMKAIVTLMHHFSWRSIYGIACDDDDMKDKTENF